MGIFGGSITQTGRVISLEQIADSAPSVGFGCSGVVARVVAEDVGNYDGDP